MSPILEYVYQVTGIDTAYILAGMLALILILLILIIVTLCKLKKLRRKLDRYMRGKMRKAWRKPFYPVSKRQRRWTR